jgi:hypothetical protein
VYAAPKVKIRNACKIIVVRKHRYRWRIIKPDFKEVGW